MIGFMYQEKLKTLKSCLTDTGASKTLISEEVYKKIPEDTRTKLSPATSLRSANNSSIQEYGKAVFEVELGGEKLQQDVVVANISNEGLLGMDILHNGSTKPADIMLSLGVIDWQGRRIPGFRVGMPGKLLTVRSSNNYHIPSESEAVIVVN